MLRTLLLMSLALMLPACGTSRKVTPPLLLPAPPSEALQSCSIPAIVAGDAAGVEAALIERGAEIARCEAKRAALVQGWPR